MLLIVDRTVSATGLTVRSLFHALLVVVITGASHAGQVVLDGTLGTSGAIAGPNFAIPSSLGKLKGKNLFQSFSQFTLDAGDTAAFTGPANIRNILARITGGNPSTIDGTIRSDIAGANLFLLNPAGVVFGPNAVLDVTGSFAVSTADYFKLAGGARFGVGLDPSEDSKLTTGPVVAFGFLGGNPGNITIQSPLTTTAGQTFSVVGGNVLLDGGQILAPDGQVNLASVKSAGEVKLRIGVNQPVRFKDVELPGLIELRNSAVVDVSGNGGGRVVIRGGQLIVENASVKADTLGSANGGGIDIGLTEKLEVLGNGKITTDAAGTGRGGDIQISAPSILLDGQDLDADFGGNSPNRTRIAAETSSASTKATGGDVVIHSDTLEMRGGAELSTSTFGPAAAGRVAVTTGSLNMTGPTDSSISPPTWIRANASPFFAGAGGDIRIRADSIQMNIASIQSDTQGDGDAGRVLITANSLTMLDGAITTRSAGRGAGGAIDIRADNILMDGIGAYFGAEASGQDQGGRGGDIQITAAAITLLNDAAILASSFGDGDAGNINVRAHSLVFDTATIPSGIIAASYGGPGNGGDINIKTDSLELQNGMQIATTSFTSGNGGSIVIRAKSVVLGTGASIQSAALDTGVAGGINLKVKDQLEMTGGSSINVSAAANEAGTIKVMADTIRVTDSLISASAPQASGGSIELFAVAGIELNNSSILAAADNNGGNIALGSPFFIFDSQFQGAMDATTFISANAVNVGGNIQIGKNFSIAEPSNITATGAQEGNIEIGALETDLSGSLIALSGNLLDAETQLRPDCGVRLTGNLSSFIVLGRGGLPIAPGGFVPSSTPAGADDRK
ncbi:MAG: filamentous hemagglutinin N-terminal domain-containing protein [Verrucomicrobiota bacterium]